MALKQIYKPIEKELAASEGILNSVLEESNSKTVSRLSDYILNSGGKRIRPALVVLSAKVCGGPKFRKDKLNSVAAASELMHIASLIHDDVIDHAVLRHNRPTINTRYGQNLSIVLGDYLYSLAFKLIASCNNTDILSCFSHAACLMCEGELTQVYERENLDLLRKRYIIIVKKKTASLFAASCQAGAILGMCKKSMLSALMQYGMNFGIAFQIADDCMDLIGKQKDIGKSPGADFKMGELTLPLINLLSACKDKNELMSLIRKRDDIDAFKKLKNAFLDSPAFTRTREDICAYLKKAKDGLKDINESFFKQAMFGLTDYVVDRIRV